MRRAGKGFIIISLIFFTAIAVLGFYFFLRTRSLPEVNAYAEIEHYSVVAKENIASIQDAVGLQDDPAEYATDIFTLKKFSFSHPESLKEWQELPLATKCTEYIAGEEDNASCIKAVSEDSASVLLRRQRLSVDANPVISWDWRVEEFPLRKEAESFDKKKDFDFAAQMYVIFPAKFFLDTRAMHYVWAQDVSVGTVATSPYTENIRIMVLERGEPGKWKHEERNVREDYYKLFGEELKDDVEGVAFMTDSDSTDSRAVAYYRDITFSYKGKKSGN